MNEEDVCRNHSPASVSSGIGCADDQHVEQLSYQEVLFVENFLRNLCEKSSLQVPYSDEEGAVVNKFFQQVLDIIATCCNENSTHVKYCCPHETVRTLSKQEQLEFYALCQQGEFGDCESDRPGSSFFGFFDADKKECEKWDMWYSLKGKFNSQMEAKVHYLLKILETCFQKVDHPSYQYPFQHPPNDALTRASSIWKQWIESFAQLIKAIPHSIMEIKEEDRLPFYSLQNDFGSTVQKEIVTIRDITSSCKKSEKVISSGITSLKYSLREIIKKLTELEYEVRVNECMDDEKWNQHFDEILKKYQHLKLSAAGHEDVNQVLERDLGMVRNSYQNLKMIMEDSKEVVNEQINNLSDGIKKCKEHIKSLQLRESGSGYTWKWYAATILPAVASSVVICTLFLRKGGKS